jgi:transposase
VLKQVKGVGTQIALTYILTIEDPFRFPKSREVSCILGLRPGRRNSGPTLTEKVSRELDNRVAAPTAARTPTLHRANIAHQRVRNGTMATGAA